MLFIQGILENSKIRLTIKPFLYPHKNIYIPSKLKINAEARIKSKGGLNDLCNKHRTTVVNQKQKCAKICIMEKSSTEVVALSLPT